MRNNSVNQDFNINADGFDLSAGSTTKRKASISGGNLNYQGGSGGRIVIPLMGTRESYSLNPIDVEGLGYTMLANVTYQFKFNLWVSSEVYTTGIWLAVNGSVTPTALAFKTLLPLTNITDDAPSYVREYDTGVVSTTMGAVADNGLPYYTEIGGMIANGSSDNDFILRFRSEVTNSSVYVLAMSQLILEKIY